LAPAARAAAARSLDLQLAEPTTVGDLLAALADRLGAPFRSALDSADERVPRHIRLFADGSPLTRRGQALQHTGRDVDGVTVVLLTPMMGG
jgi:hypothetical protein